MNVTSFKGYRYDSSVAGDPGRCIAPPYDVIDPDQQHTLHQLSKYNIVRIIKGENRPGDNDRDNIYTRSAALLREFIRSSVLKQDDRETIYVYDQEFTIEPNSYRRTGFIALGELQDYGSAIRPHEQTLAGPKEDRLNLMRATKSQTGQIFMLYSDREKTIDAILDKACQTEKLLHFKDDRHVRHRLFAVTDPKQMETITGVMSHKSVFIADGHHRYETALNYHHETDNPKAAYCMMTFVNTYNEGLVVLPTHRLLKNVADFNQAELLGEMSQYFDEARLAFGDVAQKKSKRLMMFDALKLEFDAGSHAFGMYFNDGAFYVATLRDMVVMEAVAKDKSTAWRQLDVAILHKLILEKMLGIDQAALTAQTNLEYIKDFGAATLQAIDKVDSGEAQGLFFLNSTRPEQVEAVAETGEKMPQKSTFFYPKFFSGLVINVLE